MEIKCTTETKRVGKKETNTQEFLYWFGNNPCLRPVPKQPLVLEISYNLLKSFTSKDPQGMYPPLFSLNLVDVPSTRTDPQEMYPLLFSVTTTQVDVPSTCTTKDVPSNVLRQRSQAVKPLKLCEWGYKRILRRLVL